MADAFDYHARGLDHWRRIDEAEQQRRSDRRTLFDTSSLTPPQKRRLWTRIKERDPALAAVLQDAAVRDMRELFDATVMLPSELVREILDERY
jgi:hypothetical protein